MAFVHNHHDHHAVHHQYRHYGDQNHPWSICYKCCLFGPPAFRCIYSSSKVDNAVQPIVCDLQQQCLTPSTHQSPMNGASFGQLCQVKHVVILMMKIKMTMVNIEDYLGGFFSEYNLTRPPHNTYCDEISTELDPQSRSWVDRSNFTCCLTSSFLFYPSYQHWPLHSDPHHDDDFHNHQSHHDQAHRDDDGEQQETVHWSSVGVTRCLFLLPFYFNQNHHSHHHHHRPCHHHHRICQQRSPPLTITTTPPSWWWWWWSAWVSAAVSSCSDCVLPKLPSQSHSTQSLSCKIISTLF